ncbi:hypothetical protein D1AOALGA4SA_7810 [Olavius algarvensis Delta 1 endosymbiont]|nr:hypothetical protein D1AOALGA4SA_7810 [Olavius algarvensis Delta 1 endosymbiont]
MTIVECRINEFCRFYFKGADKISLLGSVERKTIKRFK